MRVPTTARWILQGIFIFFVLVLMISLAVYAVNFRQRRKAEGLLQGVKTLRVGQSTTADVQRIVNRFGGGPSHSSASFCSSAEDAYGVWTGNQTINRIGQAVPVLGRLGLRPWGASATVILQAGKVCYVSYGLGMEDPKGEWTWMIDSNLLPAGRISVPVPEHPAYKVGAWDHRDLRLLTSQLTPEATEEERRHAFTYDLSCVTRIAGCQQRCEIAPLAWRDVFLDLQTTSRSLPIEETKDPHCKLVETTP